MGASVQLFGLLVYSLCSLAISQSQERVWHSTTPPGAIVTPAPTLDVTTPEYELTSEPSSTTSQELLESLLSTPEVQPIDTPPVVQEEIVDDADSSETTAEEYLSEASEPQPETPIFDNFDDVENSTDTEEKKPRKWMSIPEETAPPSDLEENVMADNNNAMQDLEEEVNTGNSDVTQDEPEKEVDEYSLSERDFELPKNISELLQAAEEGVPVMQETIISKKTTVYVTITESLGDNEPLFVNLSGIRDFTGKERRIVGGCLDLSDLQINGEEAMEIIKRMAKHKFHRLDLSNNNIKEFPANTFSPVAFSVRELRLDGNPLLSNCHAEESMLQRGGLFHLTELRELNLSRCGLHDVDFFTPWNSNRLEVVDLSANILTAVPTNLQFFHKLKKLYLEGNPITEVSELPFALLWNLQVLSLHSCYIHSITSDPFRNMEHLKELSLSGNNLTRITDLRLPRGSSGVKMYLSGNPWHCACDMLTFIEYHHYAVRDLEDIRCATPRWLEGLRTAYLTKEILSLDSEDGGCSPPHPEVTMAAVPVAHHYSAVRTDRLELLSLAVFGLAAVFMLVHLLWSKRKDKYKFDDERHDINYIRIDRKPSFK